MDWNEIGNEGTSKAQRQALYRFGLPRDLVRSLTSSEASALLGLLVSVSKRLKENSSQTKESNPDAAK